MGLKDKAKQAGIYLWIVCCVVWCLSASVINRGEAAGKHLPADDISPYLIGEWESRDMAVAATNQGAESDKRSAHSIRFGINGDSLTLTQGEFAARGVLLGNRARFEGRYEEKKHVINLYLLDSKFIMQKETWLNDRVIEYKVSQLVRVK